jgi:dTDP-4-dehydrorhamnose reductase
MKPLILGDGLLGTEIVKQTSWDYISRKKNNIDFLSPASYADFIMKDDYDTIINCIGYTNTIDNTKERHWNINYLGVIYLADLCNTFDKKLVHISTDYIYGNSKSCASEDDVPVHINNWYTYTKLLSDGYIQAISKKYLIARNSFKPRPFPWKTGWIDLISNLDYVEVIADLIIQLIMLDACGVYNVGTEIKTLYDLAKETQKDCIPILDDHKFERPYDVTMNLDKLKAKLNKTNTLNRNII